MNDYVSTLRREIKFVASEIFRPNIEAWIATNKLCLRKHHGDRIINNIYFDTHDYTAYSDNLAGISERAKLRYRWYGKSLVPTEGALEIKRKINAYGFKSTNAISNVDMDENQSLGYLIGAIRKEIPDRVKPMLDYYSNPIILNRYVRSYYISPRKGIRVTLDRNHSVYDQRFNLSVNTRFKANVVQNLVIEVKFHPDLTDYVSYMIGDIPMQISRNSKYINSVRAVAGY